MRKALKAATLVALAIMPLPVAAQTTVLDEGTFRLLVNGQEVGTETFAIRQNGSGDAAVVIARGRVTLTTDGGREVNSSLQFGGSGLRPAAYDLQMDGGDASRIAGKVVGGRFSARVVSAGGERMREYLVSEGAVIADDAVAHHYYFLARRAEGNGRVAVVIPRDSRQVFANVADRGSESIQVGGQTVSARHLHIETEGGVPHDVWVDSQNRVLRMAIPSRNYVAERTALP